ncbi:MAG: nucleotidyltransferase domain-containing protein [Cyanobacteria bacterium P01_A01_bin.135]
MWVNSSRRSQITRRDQCQTKDSGDRKGWLRVTFDLQKCQENFKQRQAARHAEREALRQGARERAIAAILSVVPRYPQVTQVYLFGSVVQPGQFHQGSDIDIAVVGTDAAAYFDLWRDLEAVYTDRMVDLREIDVPSHFANVVRETGELVYDAASRAAESEH